VTAFAVALGSCFVAGGFVLVAWALFRNRARTAESTGDRYARALMSAGLASPNEARSRAAGRSMDHYSAADVLRMVRGRSRAGRRNGARS